ncbi:hypothetical protein [Flavobacteriaceae bacterium 14752]|uniref:hypothetical protein n=1 Tax=Mesohalobacter salilacus TaxID=2491711 RepID=UPI000F62C9D8|nr:hypothetical protein EIG84_05905 [Flavobacteriaceae bacterium 14752]
MGVVVKNNLLNLKTSNFLGQFVSLSELETEHPNPETGSYAYVDSGNGSEVQVYVWDKNDSTYIKQAGNITNVLNQKVDKVTGKGLSEEDFTLALKNKYNNYQEGQYRGRYDSFFDLIFAVPAGGNTTNGDYATFYDGSIFRDAMAFYSAKQMNWFRLASIDHVNKKVDKVSGKGLSTEDFTTAEKEKLSTLESSKFLGQYLALAELETQHPNPVVGSYGYVDSGVGNDVNVYVWDNDDKRFIKQAGNIASETPSSIRTKLLENPDTKLLTDAEKNKVINLPINTVSSLNQKVDKVPGKGLSTEDFTTAEKEKLSTLESSKFLGQFTTIAALEADHPNPKVGSYAYVDAGVGKDVEVYVWDNDDLKFIRQAGNIASETPTSIKTKLLQNSDTNILTDTELAKLRDMPIKILRNDQTTQMSLAQLNTAYPNAIDGDEVICPQINRIYMKALTETRNLWQEITTVDVS